MSTTFFTYCQVFSLDSVFMTGSAIHFPSFAQQILSGLSLFYKRNCLSCNCKLLVCRDHADFYFGIRCGDHCLITVRCIIDFVIKNGFNIGTDLFCNTVAEYFDRIDRIFISLVIGCLKVTEIRRNACHSLYTGLFI